MKTIDIEIAVIKHFNPRLNIIVPNVSWGLSNKEYKSLHECDVLILSKTGYATEIEIKVSKSDLLNDAKKRHGHHHNLIRRLYYAVPIELRDVAIESISDKAGILVVENYQKTTWIHSNSFTFPSTRVITIREAKINTDAVKWTDEQRNQLMRLGTMRILGLKQKIQRLQRVVIDENLKTE